jgi:hypothetical protein
MLVLAEMRGTPDHLARVRRWTGLLTGRGACRHPDGAAVMLASALNAFADDFESHSRRRGCVARSQRAVAA